jgi:predicted nucleic acid-binding Zn ribbon protein
MKERRDSVPEPLAEIITRALKEAGIRRPPADSPFEQAWREVAGEDVARHSRVSSFRGGVLTVEVFTAPLREELQVYRCDELLRALRSRLGGAGPDRLLFRLA